MTLLDRSLPTLLPSPRAEPAGTELPRQVVSRALAQASALIAWAWLATAPVVILLGPGRYDVPAFLLVILVMAVVAGVTTAAAVRRPQALRVLTGVGLGAVAAAIVAFDVLSTTPGTPSNPAVSLMGSACLVAGLVLRPLPAGAAALGLGLRHAWWDLGPPWAAGAGDYAEILLTAAAAVVGARFVAVALARSSRQVGELVGGLLADRRAEQARRVRENSLAAARTDLHDTVLTTLSGIGAGWLSSADPETLRAELRRDVRLLHELERPGDDAPVDLAAAVRSMTQAPLFDRLAVRLDAAPCPVPAVHADALVLATREALVNVLKHSGADGARVAVRTTGGRVAVTVGDDGRGFDPAQRGAGLGLAGMAARLREIGGAARVDSAPGAETTVTLELSPSAPPDARPVPPLWSVEGPRRGALGLTAVAGVSQLLSFAVQRGSYDDPTPQMVALAIALAVDALVVGTLLRRPTLPGWVAAVLVVRIAAVLLLTGLPLEGCASMGYAHFSGGGELISCLVVTLLRPPREAVVAVAAFIGSWLLLAAQSDAAGRACGVTAVANSAMAVGLVVAGLVFVAALRWHAAIAAEVLEAEENLLAARSAHQVRAAERRRLLPAVRGIVTETLSGLADGRLDPGRPEVRRLCRRDARLLRAFLTQGDGDDLLAALVDRAVRLRGLGVDLAVRGTLPRNAVPDDLRTALLAELDRRLTAATDSGWRGEGQATVLRAGDDVLLTLVLHAAPAQTPAPGSATPLVDRAELVDGDLWVTFRLPGTRCAPEED